MDVRQAPGGSPGHKRVGRWCVTVVCAALLMACSPEYNWRDAPVVDGQFRAQLPAKPSTLSRSIQLEDVAVEMTMVGARVGETAFTVAVVPAPAADPLLLKPTDDRYLRMMRDQMLRNIGASAQTPSRAVDVPLVDATGERVGVLSGLAVEAEGGGSHAGERLQGLFVRGRDVALQAMIMGPPVSTEQSRHFFDSIRIVRR